MISDPFGRIIQERKMRGARLAKRFSDLPAGLSYVDFLLRVLAELPDLDFITSRGMYQQYIREKD